MSSGSGFSDRNRSSQKQWEDSLHTQLFGLEKMVVGAIVSRLTRSNKENRQDADIFDIPTLQERAAAIADSDPKLVKFKSLIQKDLSSEWIGDTLLDSALLQGQITTFLSTMNSKTSLEKLESIQGLRDKAQALQNRIAEVAPACENLCWLVDGSGLEHKFPMEDYVLVHGLGLAICFIEKDATQAVNILNGLSKGTGAAQAY